MWSVGAGEVGGGEVRWPVRREGTRLDQCLMSPGRCHDWHCPGWATLSALSRRHSANRRGDDTVTTQLELSSTTTTTFITISHHSPDTTWSCCSDKTALIFTTSPQPPEDYLIVSIATTLSPPVCISHFSLGRCRVTSPVCSRDVFNTDHVIVMTWSVGEQIISIRQCSVLGFDRF